MATISNLFVDQGSDYATVITVLSGANVPLDLNGYTVKSQMRKSFSSSQAFNFTTSLFDAANGKVKLALTAAQSAEIPAGRWLYDVEITSSIGAKKRVVEGIVTVTPQITQT